MKLYILALYIFKPNNKHRYRFRKRNSFPTVFTRLIRLRLLLHRDICPVHIHLYIAMFLGTR